MGLLEVAGALLALAALFAWVNQRWIGLPTPIGVMLVALAVSLALALAEAFGLAPAADGARALLARVDFGETVLQGMLSFLLFAGALHVDLSDLARQKRVIGLLATLGLVVSTLIVGFGSWVLLRWLGLELPLVYCLLFGALISPTDPIAVMGILRRAGAPASLETKIVGESLFNDGVAVVLFLVLAGVASGQTEPQPAAVATLLLQEAVGGALFGLAAGWLVYRMLRAVDSHDVEILLTLALVTGGYALADALHLSGPIAIVVAGLLIGNHGRLLAMSARTREHLDTFWSVLDELLNALLFVLLGLEVLVVSLEAGPLAAGVLMIPLVLLARLISVGLPVAILRPLRRFSPGAVRVLTWGGLRGGVSVALALSLPPGPERDLLLTLTYVVVVFSVLVQGLTVGPVVRVLTSSGDGRKAAGGEREGRAG